MFTVCFALVVSRWLQARLLDFLQNYSPLLQKLHDEIEKDDPGLAMKFYSSSPKHSSLCPRRSRLVRVILRSFYSPGNPMVWKAPPHRNWTAAVPPGGGSVQVTRAVDFPLNPHFNLAHLLPRRLSVFCKFQYFRTNNMSSCSVFYRSFLKTNPVSSICF